MVFLMESRIDSDRVWDAIDDATLSELAYFLGPDYIKDAAHSLAMELYDYTEDAVNAILNGA